jgi:hypothetical protein
MTGARQRAVYTPMDQLHEMVELVGAAGTNYLERAAYLPQLRGYFYESWPRSSL